MTAAPSSQDNPTVLNRKKRLRRLILFGSLLILLVAVPVALICNPPEEDAAPQSYFYVTRDGEIIELTSEGVSAAGTEITNSFEALGRSTRSGRQILEKTVAPDGSFITEFRKGYRGAAADNQNEDTSSPSVSKRPAITYSIETRNAVTDEVVSSELLFELDETDPASLECVLSKDMLLFGMSQPRDRFFWYVKSDGQWRKIDVDFGVDEDVVVLGWEILKEKKSILFLLHSVFKYPLTPDNLYASSYSYQSFSTEKTVLLPHKLESGNAEMRVLNGEKHFIVYRNWYDYVSEISSIKCGVFSTDDLTEVKEATVPNASYSPYYDALVMSPDLDYIAYGNYFDDGSLFLFDVNRNERTLLRTNSAASYRRFLADRRYLDAEHTLSLERRAKRQSIGFSEDSSLLLAADMLGNVYEWDVKKKKGGRKIVKAKN